MSSKFGMRELHAAGLNARVSGNKLIISPAARITPELRASIKESRDQIIAEARQIGGRKKKVKERTSTRRQKPKPDGGPGTELTKLIPAWAVKEGGGCDCKSWAHKMDTRGVSWCEQNLNAIVEHLVQSKEYLAGPLRNAPDALARAGARTLVRMAIRRAKSRC